MPLSRRTRPCLASTHGACLENRHLLPRLPNHFDWAVVMVILVVCGCSRGRGCMHWGMWIGCSGDDGNWRSRCRAACDVRRSVGREVWALIICSSSIYTGGYIFGCTLQFYGCKSLHPLCISPKFLYIGQANRKSWVGGLKKLGERTLAARSTGRSTSLISCPA